MNSTTVGWLTVHKHPIHVPESVLAEERDRARKEKGEQCLIVQHGMGEGEGEGERVKRPTRQKGWLNK